MGGMRKRSILLSLTGATTAAVILTAMPVVAPAIRAERTKPAAAVSVPTTTSAAPTPQLPPSPPPPPPPPTPTPAPAQPLSASAQATLVKQVARAVLGTSPGAD